MTNERYARADSSVTGQVLKIVAARPDAVITGSSGTPGALPYLALAERGYKGQIYGTHALINPDFVRVGGPAVEGLLAPTGPVIVAEQLPATNPIRKVSMDFRAAYQKANGAPPTDAFSAYTFDAWLLFADAAERALATKGEPGTPEFRVALRDAIVTTKELVGTHGVYNFKPDNRYGSDERSRGRRQARQGPVEAGAVTGLAAPATRAAADLRDAIRALVEDDRVHRDLYLSDELFALEQQHFFANTWIYRRPREPGAEAGRLPHASRSPAGRW